MFNINRLFNEQCVRLKDPKKTHSLNVSLSQFKGNCVWNNSNSTAYCRWPSWSRRSWALLSRTNKQSATNEKRAGRIECIDSRWSAGGRAGRADRRWSAPVPSPHFGDRAGGYRNEAESVPEPVRLRCASGLSSNSECPPVVLSRLDPEWDLASIRWASLASVSGICLVVQPFWCAELAPPRVSPRKTVATFANCSANPWSGPFDRSRRTPDPDSLWTPNVAADSHRPRAPAGHTARSRSYWRATIGLRIAAIDGRPSRDIRPAKRFSNCFASCCAKDAAPASVEAACWSRPRRLALSPCIGCSQVEAVCWREREGIKLACFLGTKKNQIKLIAFFALEASSFEDLKLQIIIVGQIEVLLVTTSD